MIVLTFSCIFIFHFFGSIFLKGFAFGANSALRVQTINVDTTTLPENSASTFKKTSAVNKLHLIVLLSLNKSSYTKEC